MAEEKHHHHLFHHHKEEECKPVDCKREEKHHKHKEHLGELSAVAAGAYALHEKHMAKKDPEHAHNHKIKEEVAVAVAVGAGGYAFHEHHEKKEAKKHHVGFMGANNRPLTRLGLLETHMEYVTGQPVALTLRRPYAHLPFSARLCAAKV